MGATGPAALFGGAGDDLLYGGGGFPFEDFTPLDVASTTLTGGQGDDTFSFYAGALGIGLGDIVPFVWRPTGADVIKDFTSGEDRIVIYVEQPFEDYDTEKLEPLPDANQTWEAGDAGITATADGLLLNLEVLYGLNTKPYGSEPDISTILVKSVAELVWGEDVIV